MSTKKVLKWFEEISKIPRGSKNEAEMIKYLQNWANSKSFENRRDEVGNVLITVPASKGYESSDTVVIQGHMDMVCEKTPDSSHDFLKDPIELIYDGDWLRANQTTLGADNGIALALAMAIAEDETVNHPKLELLFTVDEETGLGGALNISNDFLTGKILLNIDSEDEGVFTIGCAGGLTSNIKLPLSFEKNSYAEGYTLKAHGMKGGHSGVDIKEQRASAIKIIVRALIELSKDHDFRVSYITGGSAHNAIPRDAEAKISMSKNSADAFKKSLLELQTTYKKEYSKSDPSLALTLESAQQVETSMLSIESQVRCLNLLNSLPHGPFAMSTIIDGLVETSNNIATVNIDDGSLLVLSSQRSSIRSRLDELTQKIQSTVELAGGEVVTGDGYPAWEPNWDSKLLSLCKDVYKSKFGKEPIVEVIHAGLECGIIGSKFEGMDMISFGPTIKDPHCPDERINIKDIGKIWDLMVELFKNLK